jgi:hypothetical protein
MQHFSIPFSAVGVSALYLGCSRSARPLPRGCTGHVAHPIRSIPRFSFQRFSFQRFVNEI